MDGGSGVNILPEFMYNRFQSLELDEVPFQLKMVDQRRIQPLGILRNHMLTILGLTFPVNFVVLKMDEGDSPYPILLGRPWFTQAKVKQDWGAAKIVVRKGKKKVQLNMVPNATLPKQARALYAQGINMVQEVDDGEEDAFLKANGSVVLVFDIDVVKILE